MFTVETFDGKPLTRELAALRARFEPIIEATQIKGDSESHPFLSPSDEFADYEKWDKSNLNGTESKKPEMLKYEYAREALKTGLALDRKLSVNPFKFGMIGSTDAHTSLAAVEEDNFFGKHSGVEPGRIAGSMSSSRHLIPSTRFMAGSRRPPAMRVSGPPRTRAKPSSTR